MLEQYPQFNSHRERLNPPPPDDVLFGRSQAMAVLRAQAEKVCSTNLPILLCGECGTGKEALARWIHGHSAYMGGEFVKINCATISGALLESELFGYEQGAFTGANQPKPGRVELAHRGTLFLDEIADLDLDLQAKLLQFLQDGTYSRVGDSSERKVDVRVLCATNKDLDQQTTAGRFRQDLFFRIQVFRLNLPTLRERREDIPSLADFFRGHHEVQFGMKSQPFPPEIMEYLQNLNWNGNIRELSNEIARYVLFGPEAILVQEPAQRIGITGKSVSRAAGILPLKQVTKEAIREVEHSVILEALRANRWNRRATALKLKISYRALIYKIRDAGFVSPKTSSNSAAH